MPAHDWTRVSPGIFHDFHLAWIGELCRVLNSGLLPDDYYALGEQIAGGLGPDVLTLQHPELDSDREQDSDSDSNNGIAVALERPKAQLTVQTELDQYVQRQRHLTIRHSSDHRIVAMIEIISAGNKANRHGIRSFREKAIAALYQGIHLLLLDLHPPGPRDPQGIHGLLWEEISDVPHQHPGDKPLTLVSYSAGPTVTAYVEPFAVGDSLEEMPLFLTAEAYVKVQLEATYQAAYEGVPRFYRNILEG